MVFGADLRSLALLRILMAMVVIGDVLARIPDLRIAYTVEGVMPRSILLESFVRWRWSVNLVNDTLAFQALVWIAALAAGACMLVGYRTRWATVLVWIFVVSIQARNPFVLSGADTLIRVLLFWMMFLPLGARWSIDSMGAQDGRQSLSNRFVSFATAGLFLQVAFMYAFTALLKSGPEWRTEGTALYYALGAEHITKPFGEFLHQFPELLRFLTHASLALEFLVPVLLFVPFRNGPARTIACASIVLFHTGIFLTMDLGLFPWTSASAMAAFLPAWFWDRAVPVLRSRLFGHVTPAGTARPSLAQTLRASWQAGAARLQLQGAAFSTGTVPHDVSSHAAASSREHLRADTTAASTPTRRLKSPLPVNAFLAFCLVFVFLWNLTSVSDFTLPRAALPFGYGTGLYQRWNMFAPHPSTATSWIVVRGVLESGHDIDLLTPIVRDDLSSVSEVSWAEPEDIPGTYYGSKYWRKYLSALGREDNGEERRAFAAYSCRTWNDHYGGEARLVGLQIISMSERTLPGYEDAPTRRSVLAEYRCG